MERAGGEAAEAVLMEMFIDRSVYRQYVDFIDT
jgi:hypothetical protein